MNCTFFQKAIFLGKYSDTPDLRAIATNRTKL
jgi:hypothetical protein